MSEAARIGQSTGRRRRQSAPGDGHGCPSCERATRISAMPATIVVRTVSSTMLIAVSHGKGSSWAIVSSTTAGTPAAITEAGRSTAAWSRNSRPTSRVTFHRFSLEPLARGAGGEAVCEGGTGREHTVRHRPGDAESSPSGGPAAGRLAPVSYLPPTFDVTEETLAGEVFVLAVRGEIHIATAPEFSQRLNEAIAGGASGLLRITRRRGRMVLVCDNPTVMRLFEVTRTDETFEILPMREEALERLQG